LKNNVSNDRMINSIYQCITQTKWWKSKLFTTDSWKTKSSTAISWTRIKILILRLILVFMNLSSTFHQSSYFSEYVSKLQRSSRLLFNIFLTFNFHKFITENGIVKIAQLILEFTMLIHPTRVYKTKIRANYWVAFNTHR